MKALASYCARLLHDGCCLFRYANPESEQILAIAANLSIWRSLRKLRVDHYVMGHFAGLATLHDELTHFKVKVRVAIRARVWYVI